MADLRNDTTAWRRLLTHIQDREGLYPYFYCDSEELVTIGYGYLVDGRNAPDSTGRQIASSLADRYEFTTTAGAVAGRDAVLEDWQRVKDHGRTHANLRARAYANVARLRISNASAEDLLSRKVREFADRIYGARPYLAQVDSRIAAALVDARYNPAGVNILGAAGHIGAMWAALDRSSKTYSPSNALAAFIEAWRGRGIGRYRERHAVRVSWFLEGVTAMTGQMVSEHVRKLAGFLRPAFVMYR